MNTQGQDLIDAGGEQLPIRPALAAAIEDGWSRLAGAGMWWSGS